MKHKRLFFLVSLILFISVSIFLIYNRTYILKINYVALGDSVAAGRNPYGVDDYGYTDYVKDYLQKNDKLNSYISYAISGYTTDDVTNDINLNKKSIDNEISIKRALRESNLVTISIGANDFMKDLDLTGVSNFLKDKNIALSRVDEVIDKVDELLVLIKKYAKENIVVVGYYNPLPRLTKYKDEINEVVNYADQQYEIICNKNNVKYIKVSNLILKNSDYLPNPLDIHPSKEGYYIISKEIINYINQLY